MPDCLRLLVGFGDVVEFDLDFKFAPASFAYFEGFASLCFDVYILLVSFFLLRGAKLIEARLWAVFTYFLADSESIHAV